MCRDDGVFSLKYILDKGFEGVARPAFAILECLMIVLIDKNTEVDELQQRCIRTLCDDDFETRNAYLLMRDAILVIDDQRFKYWALVSLE